MIFFFFCKSGKMFFLNFLFEGWVEVDAPLDVLPLHVRGGYAIPLQVPGTLFLFKYQVLYSSSSTRYFIPLQVPGTLFLFKFQVLYSSPSTRYFIPLQVPGTLLLFKYQHQVLYYSSSTRSFVTLQVPWVLYSSSSTRSFITFQVLEIPTKGEIFFS